MDTLNRAVLDSLSAHVAVINREGVIVMVNRAWEQFARENAPEGQQGLGIGAHYLTTCDTAKGEWSDEAGTVAQGIRDVLTGKMDHFELEYPCHSPTEERWFLLRAVPLVGGDGGAVVSHLNITAHRRALQQAALAARYQTELKDLDTQFRERPIPKVSPRLEPGEPIDGKLLENLVESYSAALRSRLDELLFDAPSDLSPRLKSLAEAVVSVWGTPRDIVQIHTRALQTICRTCAPDRQILYLQEGRIAVLELMGYLAASYRGMSLPSN